MNQDLIIRGERAKQILEDPMFKEAQEKLERDIFEAWASTGIRDKEGQHELLLMLQTARKFNALFRSIIATGEMEKNAIKTPALKRTLERFGIYN